MRVWQSIDYLLHSLLLFFSVQLVAALQVVPGVCEVAHKFLPSDVVAKCLSFELQLPALVAFRHGFKMTIYSPLDTIHNCLFE